MTFLRPNIAYLTIVTLGLISSLLFVGSTPLYAERSDITQISSKLTELDNRLTRIEKNQKDILENQDEMLKQFHILKIWVRRN